MKKFLLSWGGGGLRRSYAWGGASPLPEELYARNSSRKPFRLDNISFLFNVYSIINDVIILLCALSALRLFSTLC